MRIASAGALDHFLDRALSWRKKELTALKLTVSSAPGYHRTVVLRAAATLLYAHWEGFVKQAGTAYLQLVSNCSDGTASLKSSFVALCLRTEIRSAGQSHRVSLHRDLVERLTTAARPLPRVPWRGVVRTRANLRASQFKEITATLGLDFSPYALKAKPVIDRLADLRNNIAHGSGLPVPEPEYATLHSEVISLLDTFRDQLQAAAHSSDYVRKGAA